MVDDDEELLQLVSTAFRIYAGFEVVHATSGPQAIELALSQPPDVMVIDLIMPEMDGEQLVHRLREHDQFLKTPILMLTATPDVAEALDVAGVQVMGKPFEPRELIARTASMLDLELDL